MSEAKKKAEELVKRFMPHSSGDSNNNEAKQCALIAVEEIIKSRPLKPSTYVGYFEGSIDEAKLFWNQVKTELNKM